MKPLNDALRSEGRPIMYVDLPPRTFLPDHELFWGSDILAVRRITEGWLRPAILAEILWALPRP